MSRHEKSCTLNPNRTCRVCQVVGLKPLPLAELISFARKHAEPEKIQLPMEDVELGLPTLTGWTIPVFRGRCGNCPACILAALRQADVYLDGFNFQEEMRDLWREHNANKDMCEAI